MVFSCVVNVNINRMFAKKFDISVVQPYMYHDLLIVSIDTEADKHRHFKCLIVSHEMRL